MQRKKIFENPHLTIHLERSGSVVVSSNAKRSVKVRIRPGKGKHSAPLFIKRVGSRKDSGIAEY